MIKQQYDETYYSSSLCWDCARACGNANCEWADSLDPVPGWVLDPPSNRVLHCPKFIPGSYSADIHEDHWYNTHNNDPSVIGTKRTFCRPRREPDDVVTYSCPICGSKFNLRPSSCPVCRVQFLWSTYTVPRDYAALRSIQNGGK